MASVAILSALFCLLSDFKCDFYKTFSSSQNGLKIHLGIKHKEHKKPEVPVYESNKSYNNEDMDVKVNHQKLHSSVQPAWHFLILSITCGSISTDTVALKYNRIVGVWLRLSVIYVNIMKFPVYKWRTMFGKSTPELLTFEVEKMARIIMLVLVRMRPFVTHGVQGKTIL